MSIGDTRLITRLSNIMALWRNMTVPEGYVRMDLSLILVNGTATDELNTKILECLSDHTRTLLENWAVNETDPFTDMLTQIDLYAVVPTNETDYFLSETDAFIRNDSLTACVKTNYVSFEPYESLIPGRTVVATMFVGLGAPSAVEGWVIGVCIACVALLAVTALVVTAPGVGAADEGKNEGGNTAAEEETEEERLDRMFYTEVARNATVDELAGVTPNQNVSISTPTYNNPGS